MTSPLPTKYRFKTRLKQPMARYGFIAVALLLLFGFAGYKYLSNRHDISMTSPISNTTGGQSSPGLPANLHEKEAATAEPMAPEQQTGSLPDKTGEHKVSHKNQADGNGRCTSVSRGLTKEYSRQADRNLRSLNSRLSYPVVGSSISTQYIRNYNQSAADLYESYRQQSEAKGCPFMVEAPVVLEDSYPQ